MVTNYMRARLQLLAEGGVLVGTPEDYVERHERAYADLLARRVYPAPSSEPDFLNIEE